MSPFHIKFTQYNFILNLLIIFYIYIYRSISLPSVQKAVGRVASGSRLTMSTKDKNKIGNDEVVPDMKPQVEPELMPPASHPANPEKEVSVVILEANIEHYKPEKGPSAKRAKPFMGPHRQTDQLTVNEMKKNETPSKDETYKGMGEVVIEDCQVPVDNTSYADWLLEQGLDKVPETADTPISNPSIHQENVKPQPDIVKPPAKNTAPKLEFDPDVIVQEYMEKF